MTGERPQVDGAEPRSALYRRQVAPKMTVLERMAAGKRLRERVPRRSHADYRPAPARADPLAILEAENATRLVELVPVRHARMLTSPFAFLRGAAGVMAADLSSTPATGTSVQACGDMHVANFGVFGSVERSLVFGINDFDETLPGPWEWDLKRLATSAVVAARFLGGDAATAETAARAAVASYRERVREYAELGHLATWYARIDETAVVTTLPPEMRQRAEQFMRRAREHTHLQVLDKMTDLVDSRSRRSSSGLPRHPRGGRSPRRSTSFSTPAFPHCPRSAASCSAATGSSTSCGRS